MFKLCLALISLGIIAQVNAESVPAFIFGDKVSTFLPALKHVRGEEFVTLVRSQADKDTLTVVFVEDKLSVEDLSQCKLNTETCFENLRKTDKTYLPSVEHPVDSLISAYGDNKKSISVSSDIDLKDVNLDGEKILFVYLDDVEGPEDFSNHDELMNKILKELKSKYGDVIAVYTGIHPSFTYPLKRRTRQAEPAETKQNEGSTVEPPKQQAAPRADEAELKTHVFTNDKHVLVALKQMIIVERKPNAEPVTVDAASLTLSVSNVSGEPVQSFIATLAGSGHTLEMSTYYSGGTWEAKFKYNSNDETKERFKARSAVIAYGTNYGFGCGDLYIESHERTIRLIGFQYQPDFYPTGENLDARTFSNSVSDCVGFFSPGIWAALFVVILLLSIMTYGISMMMDIRTMDKFDDPKGKTITVSAQE